MKSIVLFITILLACTATFAVAQDFQQQMTNKLRLTDAQKIQFETITFDMQKNRSN